MDDLGGTYNFRKHPYEFFNFHSNTWILQNAPPPKSGFLLDKTFSTHGGTSSTFSKGTSGVCKASVVRGTVGGFDLLFFVMKLRGLIFFRKMSSQFPKWRRLLGFVTLLKLTAILPLKIGKGPQKERIVSQSSIFRCELLVSGRVNVEENCLSSKFPKLLRKICGEQLQQSPFSGIADKKYTIPDSGYSNLSWSVLDTLQEANISQFGKKENHL